jgi:predicted RecA/RadA family phage recombinase
VKNFVQDGNIVTLAAPVTVASGAGLLVGTLFGVAAYDALVGADVEVAVTGVYNLPKAVGALTQGQKIYWDNTAKNVTGTVGTNTFIGCAVLPAASGDATARIRLNGVSV